MFLPDTSLDAHQPPTPTTAKEVDINFVLADCLHSNTHLHALTEADRRKTAHNTLAHIPNFSVGDLVQMYDSKADFNYAMINKMTPRWSTPCLIVGKFLNLFTLSTTQGAPLKGLFHTRRLRPFIPLRGSTLDIISPHNVAEPTEEDLDIAEAEEHMADNLIRSESPQGES